MTQTNIIALVGYLIDGTASWAWFSRAFRYQRCLCQLSKCQQEPVFLFRLAIGFHGEVFHGASVSRASLAWAKAVISLTSAPQKIGERW
jgi:hypothetical protein